MLLRKLFLTHIITRTHEVSLHIGIINEVFFRKIFAAPSSILGLLRFRNLSAGQTALSLVSIKMANIYEIRRALYGAG